MKIVNIKIDVLITILQSQLERGYEFVDIESINTDSTPNRIRLHPSKGTTEVDEPQKLLLPPANKKPGDDNEKYDLTKFEVE